MLFLQLVFALLLDKLFAEPKRLHPLVGFGHWANWLEKNLNTDSTNKPLPQKCVGVIALLLALLPVVFIAAFVNALLVPWPWLYFLFNAALLYLCIGWQSLLQHAKAIAVPLADGDIATAREQLAMIVSRDTKTLCEKDIAKAATESVLENGADAIFSAIFWFCLLGAPAVVLYRLANTLDAMWGYKNTRFLHFGWAAARFDDVLNFLPARLTALSYALMGDCKAGLKAWREQGINWKSPNAGPVMAAGSGALQVSLGGAATYHGEIQQRLTLGPKETAETQANAASITAACLLLNKTVLLWCVVIAAVSLLRFY